MEHYQGIEQWTKQENKKGGGTGNCFCQIKDTAFDFFFRSSMFPLGVGVEKQELVFWEVKSRLTKLGQWLPLVRNRWMH